MSGHSEEDQCQGHSTSSCRFLLMFNDMGVIFINKAWFGISGPSK